MKQYPKNARREERIAKREARRAARKGIKPIGRVYAGPEPQRARDDNAMNDVYAGPEMMEERASSKKKNNVSAMCGVYAGPEMMEPRPALRPAPQPPKHDKNDPPIMCVYAGPDYFRAQQVNLDEENKGMSVDPEEALKAEGPFHQV